jgi:predicted PurR-regulated permease PerM
MARLDEVTKPSWMLILASSAVVVAALDLAKGALIPLTLAVLLSFSLSPICDWLERRKLGRISAVLLTAVLGFCVLGAVSWTAVNQMTRLVPEIPDCQAILEARFSAVNAYVAAARSSCAGDFSPV